jgi:hypothetical protein
MTYVQRPLVRRSGIVRQSTDLGSIQLLLAISVGEIQS